MAPGSAANTNLQLDSGGAMRNLRFEIEPAGAIAGTVVDSHGAPVVGAIVSFEDEGRNETTNDKGEFRLDRLVPGKYKLRAKVRSYPLPAEIRTDGSKEEELGPTWFPSALSREQGSVVEVKPGAEVNAIEIHMALIPIVRVSGVVTGVPTGTKRVAVTVPPDSGAEVRNGKFTIWRLPPGKRSLYAESHGPEGSLLVSAPVEIEIAGANIDNLELELVPEFELAGKIQWEGTPPAADQLGNAYLHIWREGQRIPYGQESAQGKIAADGTFRIPHVTVGMLSTTLQGLPTNVFLKSAALDGKEFPKGALNLRNAPGKSVLTVVLSTAAAEIRGVAGDSNGPQPECAVYLIPMEDGKPQFDAVRHLQSGKDGTYAFRGIAPGKYMLFAMAGEDAPGAYLNGEQVPDSEFLETVDVSEGDKLSRNLRVGK